MFSPDTRVTLRPLSITPAASQSAGFMVGDLARGEFIEVPAIAIAVIGRLRTGASLAQTARTVRDETGIEVDVADFVQTLLDVGFVAAVDAVPVRADGPRLTDGGRFGRIAAFGARPFYTAPAWVCYAALFGFCLVTLTSVASLRPHYGQWFFLPNPVLSLALLLLMTTPLRALHEGVHWLGIRVQGLPARITVSRRYYLLVFQTDLSALWSVPRRRRYAPLLAGLALDTVLTSILIVLRWSQITGRLRLPHILTAITAALILAQVPCILFQFVLFLRTDLYAAVITRLGCVNLTRISRLRMARRYRTLSAAEQREFDSASEADLRASRWYGWLQIAGAAIAAAYFVLFLAPATVHIVRWVAAGMSRSAPTGAEYWYVLISGCVAVIPVAIPLLLYIRERRTRQFTALLRSSA